MALVLSVLVSLVQSCEYTCLVNTIHQHPRTPTRRPAVKGRRENCNDYTIARMSNEVAKDGSERDRGSGNWGSPPERLIGRHVWHQRLEMQAIVIGSCRLQVRMNPSIQMGPALPALCCNNFYEAEDSISAPVSLACLAGPEFYTWQSLCNG